MGQSHAVRARDVSRLLSMAIDICTEAVDPLRRKQTLLAALCETFRARIGVVAEIDEPGLDGSPGRYRSLVDHGWDSPAQYRDFQARLERVGPNGPIAQRIFARPEPAFTHRREDLVPDGEWYECAYVNEVQKPVGLDGLMTLHRRLPAAPHRGMPATSVAVGLHRPPGDAAFTLRDVRLFAHLNEALEQIYPRVLFDGDEHVWRALTPRLRQTLEMILAGRSDKSIAESMQISRHTAHDYTRDLLRRFNVNSRTALMAKVNRRQG